MRLLVCDTGPILHLYEAGLLDWLGALGSVYVPPAVREELSALVSGWRELRPPWLLAQSPRAGMPQALASICDENGLGEGETEAISLALELRADWLLTDDTMARMVAEVAGLEVHGSLGVVLLRAVRTEVADHEARAALDRLAASSLWLSQRILTKATAMLDELRNDPR